LDDCGDWATYATDQFTSAIGKPPFFEIARDRGEHHKCKSVSHEALANYISEGIIAR
jgi:hypothetical protein